MSDKSGVASQVITLPTGGGAMQGLGETFTPDLLTGSGSLSVPIAVPAGRRGFQPSLSLSYSTGNGNGPFGLGWSLSVPEISRKTTQGIPRYLDDATDPGERDTFLLSGADDLVPMGPTRPGVTGFRPRVEGMFARIERSRTASEDVWQIAARDGSINRYGVSGSAEGAVADPGRPSNVFCWKLTETADPLGNRIRYEYRRDRSTEGGRRFDQLYLDRVSYVDLDDDRFLITVRFDYEQRPDEFSTARAGFEIRTRLRCRRIEVRSHATGDGVLTTSYELVYLDEQVASGEVDASQLPVNGISLLSQIRVVGHDGTSTQPLPPLDLGYSNFDPGRRKFRRVEGTNGTLPRRSLADDDLELVDLFGNGLPDIAEIGTNTRFWRNLGNGLFDAPRTMSEVPTGVRLGDPGTQLCDLNGDGRADLLILGGGGYFPLSFHGRWNPDGFVRYPSAPSVPFGDGKLRLVDLDGDGVIDALRTGPNFELFINRGAAGWDAVRTVPRRPEAEFPDVDFSDAHVKLADLSGDGLQDIVRVEQGKIVYWPAHGHGRWGRRTPMAGSPVFRDRLLPAGQFDPGRVLFGDVDGDGVDDVVYVEPDRVTIWINQSGNGWGEPITLDNTPRFTEVDAVRLVDLLGQGTVGILWTKDATGSAANTFQFLDLNAAVKPYLLTTISNHRGARTGIEYTASTAAYLADEARPQTRWIAPLPFPVQVVDTITVVDEISRTQLTTEHRYHHGYWDGAEREFRGFGLVEQLDTTSFESLQGHDGVDDVPAEAYAAPTLRRSWFHLGPVGEEGGPREEADLSPGFWPEDPPFLAELVDFDPLLPPSLRAGALRALRGSVLRTELYGLDGSADEQRPYQVTESLFDVREESPPAPGERSRQRVFFPQLRAERSTRWDRGDDPMTSITVLDSYDPFGQPVTQTQIACPRGWRRPADKPDDSYLGTRTTTSYATPTAAVSITDRISSTTTRQLPTTRRKRLSDILQATESQLALVGQSVSYYDGEAFVGLPLGQVGQFGLIVRSETLILTEDVVALSYAGTTRPPYLETGAPTAWTDDYPDEFRQLLPARAGYDFADGTDGRVRGWFAQTTRHRYDVHGSARQSGLLLGTLTPTGGASSETVVRYDPFGLFAVEVVDPAGLVTTAAYDYRAMRPRVVTEPNGSRTVYRYTPLGLLASSASQAPAGEPDGDTEQVPSTVYRYDLLAFAEHGEPVSARTTRRVHHARAAVPAGADRDAVVETTEFSDGFNRLVQSRTQAEDVLFGDPTKSAVTFGHEVVPANGSVDGSEPVVGRVCPPGAMNVVVSGAVRYDNKGRVIERSEPFFGRGLAYEDPRQGTPADARVVVMRYDPLGRLLTTRLSDGSRSQVVYGRPDALDDPERYRPTPWEAFTYDANDNSGRTHPETSADFRDHRNTPSSALVDPLGRRIATVSRTRRDGAVVEIVTRHEYDIRGNCTQVLDPRRRPACRFVFDLANRPLRVDSIDAGLRMTTMDAAGHVIERRDSKGALLLQAYDVLLRPVRLWARDDRSARVTLRERLEYGDGGRADQPAAERSASRAAHRLGRLHRHHDEAGRLTFDAYDFAGNVARKLRQVIDDRHLLAAFPTDPSPDWTVPAFRVDWQPPTNVSPERHAETLLDPTVFETSYSYDALTRVSSATGRTDGTDAELLRFGYNRAGALERVRLGDQEMVEHIAYNAAGQRTLVSLAGGLVTRYAYDLRSGRLARLRTEACSVAADRTRFRPNGAVLQDYDYGYDLVGNPTTIIDRTPGSGVRGNPEAMTVSDPALRALVGRGDALVRRFGFDPLYRLITATGRECTAPPSGPWWSERARCGFGAGGQPMPDQDNARDLTSLYRESYDYDDAGSLIRMGHTGSAGFTRRLRRAEDTNRLRVVESDGDSVPYLYDDNGNLVAETESRRFEWDFGDRLKAFRTQIGGAEPSVHVHYLCDAGGQVVKRFVRRQGGEVESTIELDGLFVHQRFGSGGNLLVQVLDQDRIVAIVRRGPAHPKDGGPVTQLYLTDHLGNASLVLDDAGEFVNREELTPYGEPTFGGFGRKRYRFAGRERDDDSGLSRHGVRCYAPWFGGWISCDPHGAGSPGSTYAYAAGNPLRLVDPDGLDDQEPRVNFSFGLTLTTGSLEQNVSVHASVTAQVPAGHVGLEGGARTDLFLFRKRMGVSEWGAVAGTTYFVGGGIGDWHGSGGEQLGINSATLSFPGSGLPTGDRRLSGGLGWTNFTDLQVSSGSRLLLNGELGGQRLDQKIGHFYLRGSTEDQSARVIVSNDAFGGDTDWWETMSVQLTASAQYRGDTLEFATGVRALTDPIVLKPDASGHLTRQHTGPEPGAPNGYYLTHKVGANHFPLYLRFTNLSSGGSLTSLYLGVDEPAIQRVQQLIHTIIDKSFFKPEAARGFFWQIDRGYSKQGSK